MNNLLYTYEKFPLGCEEKQFYYIGERVFNPYYFISACEKIVYSFDKDTEQYTLKFVDSRGSIIETFDSEDELEAYLRKMKITWQSLIFA